MVDQRALASVASVEQRQIEYLYHRSSFGRPSSLAEARTIRSVRVPEPIGYSYSPTRARHRGQIACGNIRGGQGLVTPMTTITTEGFLGRLPADDAQALMERSRRRRLPAGSVLFLEGDDAHTVLFLLEGQVKILITSSAGREVVLDVLGPGEIIGELSAIDGLPRSATATALSPVEIATLRTSDFQALIEARASIARQLLVLVAVRLRSASRRQFELASSDALALVCGRLAHLAGDGRAELRVSMSQSDLAAWAGLSREAVVKALRTLRTLGWIESRNRDIVLLDVDAIRLRAEPGC
ncbi:MAG: Crp/Fnr family transcriptional regulator [Actinobacteria bacterium]|nr:MAG: Crp/Fnr family transcriptional regulator [Actinomycetota bacterium]